MAPATNHLGQFGAALKGFARRLLTVGENRLELLMVEVPGERGASCTPSCWSFRRGQRTPAEPKAPWLQTILKGAGLFCTIWLAFRAQGHDQKDK